MSSDRHDDARLEAIESKLAFAEHTLDALSEVVAEQGRALERLERRLGELAARVPRGTGAGEGDGEAGTDPLDERPPHY